MDYELMTKHILYEFNVSRRYIAYDYIVYGIHLMETDEKCIEHITKNLYLDIADKYHTTSICVERVIRTTIENIWRNQEDNKELIIKVFGEENLGYRPTNTMFFQMLFDYIATYASGCRAAECPFYGCSYCAMAKVKEENRQDC